MKGKEEFKEDPLYRLVPKNILEITPYVPGKPIEEVKRELGLSRVIKLASNENALGPSPKAVQAIKESLSRIHLYPDGGAWYLKRDLASYLQVAPENIIPGNGSDEIVSLLTRIFIQPGDEAIMYLYKQSQQSNRYHYFRRGTAKVNGGNSSPCSCGFR